ncbi:putative O-glycosylation ligase, exosortase A system-associated, partial [Roseateles sp. GG27B]
MRDLIIISIVLAGSIAALRRPWIGVLLWTWLSIMNPHRYSWGIAYDAPLAALAAVTTLLGLIGSKEKESPFIGSPVIWFMLFSVWVTLSWLNGLEPENDYWQWNKVMKINLMIFVALAVIRSKMQIILLTWVAVGSLALLGIKGGVFTIMHGGN